MSTRSARHKQWSTAPAITPLIQDPGIVIYDNIPNRIDLGQKAERVYCALLTGWNVDRISKPADFMWADQNGGQISAVGNIGNRVLVMQALRCLWGKLYFVRLGYDSPLTFSLGEAFHDAPILTNIT